MSVAWSSSLTHVSVSSIKSKSEVQIRSLIIKLLLESDLTLKSAIFALVLSGYWFEHGEGLMSTRFCGFERLVLTGKDLHEVVTISMRFSQRGELLTVHTTGCLFTLSDFEQIDRADVLIIGVVVVKFAY